MVPFECGRCLHLRHYVITGADIAEQVALTVVARIPVVPEPAVLAVAVEDTDVRAEWLALSEASDVRF